MEIKLYLQMMRKGWWMIALSALIALAASLGLSYVAAPQYKATASFLITPSATLTVGRDVLSSLATLDSRSILATYAEVMNSRRIYLETLSALQITPGALDNYTILAVVLPESSVLELSVSGPDPKMAAELANAIGNQSIKFSRSVNQVYDLNFLDSASTPKSPFSPQPVRDASLALVLGAATGALLVILSEQIRIPLEAYRQHLRIDSVTGVYNNRYFKVLLESEISRHPEESLSIGIVELYGLHDLLQTVPVSVSTRLLRTIRDRMRNELRGNDSIGRWTETSFVVMLPATPGAAANRTFERIYQSLAQPIVLEDYRINVDADPVVGGAVYSNNISPNEILQQAETALEQARKDNLQHIYVWELKNPFWVQKNLES